MTNIIHQYIIAGVCMMKSNRPLQALILPYTLAALKTSICHQPSSNHHYYQVVMLVPE